MLSVAATYVFTMVLPYIKIGDVGLTRHSLLLERILQRFPDSLCFLDFLGIRL